MRISLKHVSKSFGTHLALSDITVDIPECKTLAFIGPSGGGKSTLLRLIAGLTFPDNGQIFLDEREVIFDENQLRMHRSSIGIVFQSWNLFPHMTALENISLPLKYVYKYSASEANELGMQLLDRFGLKEHAHKKPFQLSGGQSQRVAIVRAIAIKPKLLVFDEPTSALDPLMTAEVLDLIVELKQGGSNLILASHHMSFVRKIADWILFLDEGKLKESASAEDFFKNPKNPDVKYFLEKVLKY